MNKKTVRIWVAVIVVCLLISGIYILTNRSTKREPTQQEIEAYAPYAVDWTAVPGWEDGMTEKEFILSLCTYEGEQEIGSNTHKIYTSEILANYLYQCREITEITELNGTLYISYFGQGEDMNIIAYDDNGLCEKAIYIAETDTLYHEINGTIEVWSKFRTGFQWGE